MLDPAAIRFARTLYRLWRLRRWQRREKARREHDLVFNHRSRRAMRPSAAERQREYAEIVRRYPLAESRAVLHELLATALQSTGLRHTVVEDQHADGYRVTLINGKHSATTFVSASQATNPQLALAVAKVLYDRVSAIESDAPVHAHQTPLR
jgi:hypothetical protein